MSDKPGTQARNTQAEAARIIDFIENQLDELRAKVTLTEEEERDIRQQICKTVSTLPVIG